ncbi:MAG: relaxase/mobilization nuclease domain-containing protein [Bacteroidetes bacterium]|nr:relaxase/mobilization nuclease domain-containing protein [Bacteroidota bacterium]
MIVKTIGAKGAGSYGRLIDYILRDEAALRDKDGAVVTIQHNVFGSPREMEAQFKMNNDQRLHHRANNNALVHAILAISHEDKENVTPEMLQRLSRDFINMIDPDSLAFGALHMDGNPHAHILIGGSNLLGESTRVSRERFQEIKQELQEVQMREYPELADSVVEHGGGHMAQSDAEYQIRREGRVSRKEELKEMLAVSYDLAHSRKEFFDLLAEDNLKVYERGGAVKGIEDESRNYRFQTLGIDMAELDKREERLSELEGADFKEKEPQKSEEEHLSIEEERMRELDEIG